MLFFPYLINYNTLLQKATDVITKCDKALLQNTSGFLLQIVTFITKLVGTHL